MFLRLPVTPAFSAVWFHEPIKFPFLSIEVQISFLSLAIKILSSWFFSPDFSISVNDTVHYQAVKPPRLLFLASDGLARMNLSFMNLCYEFILHQVIKLNVWKHCFGLLFAPKPPRIYALFIFCSNYGVIEWTFLQNIIKLFASFLYAYAVCWVASVVSNSLWPHGLYPARLHLSLGFSRHKYWSGLPCPSPGDLPNPGIKPGSPALQEDSLTTEPPEKVCKWLTNNGILDLGKWVFSGTLFHM